MRILLSALLVIHGLIHLMGFAKAFGLAELPQLHEPISRPLGVLWLAAALLFCASALTPARSFWMVAGVALILSQIVIFSAWSDAKFGSLANLVVLLAVLYSFASQGPFSMRAESRRDRASLLRASAAPSSNVSEADLSPLPAAVQRYLRVTGAVGQPRAYNVRAHWRGRIRGAANEAWMSFDADQLNSWRPSPDRLFSMSATMRGLPVDVYHRFAGDNASFRVRLLSVFPMVDASGPELNRAETVTILNDLCVLAPSALLDQAITFEDARDDSVRVRYTRGAESVSAELRFNAAGELVDFISDDRLRSSADGKSFVRQRWSTPVSDYRSFGTLRLSTHAKTLWHPPEGPFVYGEFELLDVQNNIRDAQD